jgi:cell division protease FtsH
MLAEGADPVRKISISPRGQSFGVTFAAPDADRHNYSDRELRARTDVALGRRAAEEILLGGVTTGAEALGLWGSRPRIIGRASSDDLAVHFA